MPDDVPRHGLEAHATLAESRSSADVELPSMIRTRSADDVGPEPAAEKSAMSRERSPVNKSAK
jgi:hypothetical protein